MRDAQIANRRMHTDCCPESGNSGNRQRLPQRPRWMGISQATKHRYPETQ
jgi:hypothetical protein